MSDAAQLVLVSRFSDDHVHWIMEEAKQRGITTRFLTGEKEQVLRELASLEHCIIYWRSARLTSRERTEALRNAQLRGCMMINQAIVDTPDVRSKRYQQEMAKNTPGIRGITTVEANEVATLSFPVIAKPPIGSQGNGIVLLDTLQDFLKLSPEEASRFIYQSFIPNDCDYRVFVVGGVPLGVMKRRAKAGEFRNNLCQGGTGETVPDPVEHEQAVQLAVKVATLFKLQLCGVDLIRHAHTGEWFFMEVNTVPQWNGDAFQKTTGVPVAKYLIDYVQALLDKNQQSAAGLAADWYEGHMEHLPSIAFHWWSRRYLWSREPKYLRELEKLRAHVFGRRGDVTDHFVRLLRGGKRGALKFPEARQRVMEKYPGLLSVQSVLIKTLFAKTIYGQDVRPAALQAIGRERLLELWTALQRDEGDLINLSTYAVNTLYLIDELFGEELGISLDPAIFLRAMEYGLNNMEGYRARDLVYLATHAVIGATAFYYQPITKHRDIYSHLLRLAEQIIREHDHDVALDAKIEFVVTHRLLGTSSALEEEILTSAAQTTAPYGVFITDPKKKQGANMLKAEHRNILFVMANTPWNV